MSKNLQPRDPHLVDSDGVRVVASAASPRWRSWLLGLSVLVGFALAVWLLQGPGAKSSPPVASVSAPTAASLSPPPAAAELQRQPSPTAPDLQQPVDSPPSPNDRFLTADASADEWISSDPNDIARYVSPSDPEPTVEELIHALRETGERGGIAAFNPPGTSPPLVGIAVPEDFPLPPGYVRHYQSTDDGQAIEPILMYAPDHRFFDEFGNEIEIPEDRVVPPDRLPAGLVARAVEIPVADDGR